MNKRILRFVVAALILSLLAAPTVASASAPAPAAPGDFITLEQTIPVNIVLIGYEEAGINADTLLAVLPATYTPVVRVPQFYGLPGRDLGLKYIFDYHLRRAPTDFEDRFFNYLTDIGASGDLTFYQQAYNDMANNVLDVSDTVLFIDAPSVEGWLAGNAHRLGIDIEHSYTVFFVNWHSRADFQFHVYTKTDEPDPDTGVNFGDYPALKMIAWGGTHSRTWFYDLSAGPEFVSGSFDVDHDDLDGDGLYDARVPPIWEYAEDGYSDPSWLSNDLGVLTRWVAINLLFTTSPLYDPMVTAPGVGGGKVAHLAMFEDDPDTSGLDLINLDLIHTELQDFEPYYAWEAALVDHDPIEPEAERAFRIWTGLLEEDDCWNAFGFAFAELFCFFDANRDTYIPGYGDEDYVIGALAYNTTDANMGDWFWYAGMADDNYVDGTQSYVYVWDYPFLKNIGFGFSINTLHEVGHHLGLSHPHDGYDSEYGFGYGSGGDFYFAWAGDESDTVMHYLQLTTGFSQFDRDNMYRWETAGYLNEANSLLDDVLADPDAHLVRDQLRDAQAAMQWSVQNFNEWNYLQAVVYARQARDAVLKAAQVVGVSAPIAPVAVGLPARQVPHEGDPIRLPILEP